MNLLDYIKGNRKGKEAHRLEKAAMSDPFLSDALEGFDSVSDDHAARIYDIQKRMKAKSEFKKKRHPIWQIAAASAIVVLGVGSYFMIESHRSNLYAQIPDSSKIMDIYIPEVFYAEHIMVIAEKNKDLAKEYKPNISRFKIDEKIDVVISKEEMDVLTEKKIEPIEVYIPEDFYERNKDKDEKPKPVIGFEKYSQYLRSSLKRPTDDICKDRKGKVAITFSVDENGQPYDFEVVWSLCGTSDEEAVRLVKEGPKWTKGTERAMVKVIF